MESSIIIVWYLSPMVSAIRGNFILQLYWYFYATSHETDKGLRATMIKSDKQEPCKQIVHHCVSI